MPASSSRGADGGISGAVFLSYASQDADAARRIADALRAAGVEVWFDREELRGGDAWDAKIRKQIRECALFVPLISAQSQARLEGYFRLEWKLAALRTQTMADAKPFLLPVAIDGIRESDAHVPEAFCTVQWTRLDGPDGVGPFCERVRTLLAAAATSDRSSPAPARGERQDAGLPARRRTAVRGWRLTALAGLGAALVGFVVWRLDWRSASLTEGPAGGVAARPAAEARELAERARRHFQGIFTRADLAIAEDLGRRATELDPTLALGWAVRAGANACYLMRGFVAGEAAQQRARDAQAFAAQALALNRDETEALIALGQVARFQGATEQAESFYRRVLKKEPENSFARRYVSIVLRTTGRAGEAIDFMQAAVRRHPRDTLAHYDLALAYAYGWNWPRAWESAEAALAIEPFPGALMLQVRLAYQWKGDVALMRRLLDRVDVTYRGEDDAVVWDMRCGLLERNPGRVLEAAGRTARNYLEESFIFPAPKAWYTAQAYRLDNKPALARQHWAMAAAVVRERMAADPQNLDLRLKHAVTLAWLKETASAQAELATIEEAWREQLNADRAWDLASFYAALGDAARAVPLLRQALHAGTGIAPLTLSQLKLDPWWDEIRTAPEFAELVATARPLPPPARP